VRGLFALTRISREAPARLQAHDIFTQINMTYGALRVPPDDSGQFDAVIEAEQ
jgi:hypothetical protein